MGEWSRSGSAGERASAGVGMAKLLIAPPRGQDPGEGRGRGCGAPRDPAPSCRFAGWGLGCGGGALARWAGLLKRSVPEGAWALVRTGSPGPEVGTARSGRRGLSVGAELLGCRRLCGGELSGLSGLCTRGGGAGRPSRPREPVLEPGFWAKRAFIGLWARFLG